MRRDTGVSLQPAVQGTTGSGLRGRQAGVILRRRCAYAPPPPTHDPFRRDPFCFCRHTSVGLLMRE